MGVSHRYVEVCGLLLRMGESHLPWILAVGGPPWVGSHASSPFRGWATPPRWKRPRVFVGFSTARSVNSICHVHAVGGVSQPMRCAHAVGGSMVEGETLAVGVSNRVL